MLPEVDDVTHVFTQEIAVLDANLGLTFRFIQGKVFCTENSVETHYLTSSSYSSSGNRNSKKGKEARSSIKDAINGMDAAPRKLENFPTSYFQRAFQRTTTSIQAAANGSKKWSCIESIAQDRQKQLLLHFLREPELLAGPMGASFNTHPENLVHFFDEMLPHSDTTNQEATEAAALVMTSPLSQQRVSENPFVQTISIKLVCPQLYSDGCYRELEISSSSDSLEVLRSVLVTLWTNKTEQLNRLGIAITASLYFIDICTASTDSKALAASSASNGAVGETQGNPTDKPLEEIVTGVLLDSSTWSAFLECPNRGLVVTFHEVTVSNGQEEEEAVQPKQPRDVSTPSPIIRGIVA